MADNPPMNNEKSCEQRYFELDGELGAMRSRAAHLEIELELTDKLYNDMRRVIQAIPECPEHGECIPHAMDWIERSKNTEDALTQAYAVISELAVRNLSGVGTLCFTGKPICVYCQMEAESLDNPQGDYPHAPDCPIVKARQWMRARGGA